ncbi:MAG: nuclear transport factor 2 family protein [Deltaproteobacteria bacterium]|nr:nuclear transport factor 2 family protein [Deltaproteobacteria bacterium]
MNERIARLLDQQEIERVIHDYCRGIDRRDLALVRSCYHDDATDHHGSFFGTADEYVVWVDKLLARYRFTTHALNQVTVEFGPDPDRAAVETYGISVHRGDPAKPHQNLATAFRYLDRFERRAGRFKIASRVAIGEWSLRLPETAWWDIPESHVASRRDATDPIYALLASVGIDGARRDER